MIGWNRMLLQIRRGVLWSWIHHYRGRSKLIVIHKSMQKVFMPSMSVAHSLSNPFLASRLHWQTMSRFGYVQEVIFPFFGELIHLSISRAKSLLKMEIPIRIWFCTSQSHPVIILQSKERTWANLHIYTYTLCSMHIYYCNFATQ